MFITFRYRCPTCGHEEDRFVRRDQMDVQTCERHKQSTLMARLPAAPRTTFRFADRNLKR